VATYGEAWVDLHAKTDRIEPETDAALHKMGKDTEDTVNKVGHNWGREASRGLGEEVEKAGPDLIRRLERGLKGKKVRTKVSYQLDRDNNVVKTWFSHVIDDIEEAASDAGRPGGPLNKVGQGFADAIGAGFNVSGKSSLILLLVPLVGVIVGLVGAALQAINALAAAVTTLPALLAAVGLQVGVLMAAFNGMGTAISKAFSAKNAKELQEALKGLTPPAQEFVRALLPLKGFFRDLQMVAQANFFKAFGADVIPKIFKSLGPTVLQGFITLGRVLGETFRNIALFFASPDFRQFVKDIIPSTVKFLQFFGPSFTTFLKGLIALADASLPFLNALGQMLGGTLESLGVFFQNAAKDPKTLQWFRDMQKTLEAVLELFGQATQFVIAFLDALNKGGGPALIQALSDAFAQLAFFFSTPVGVKAMEGLVDLAIISIKLFTGFIEVVGLLLVVLESLGEFVNFTVLNWDNLFLGFAIILGTVGAALFTFFKYIGAGLVDFFRLAFEFQLLLVQKIVGGLEAIYNWFKGIGERVYKAIKDAFAAAGHWLYERGRALIQGFIDGIYSMLGLLRNVGSSVGKAIADFLPGSPAEEGPLSGQGYVKLRGERMMRDFAEGIKMGAPDLEAASLNAVSNITFGKDSINVRYEGVSPTEQQARTTGSAVGSGILDKLAVRNTRLAVRTL
jgi:hypothetical protein